MAAVSELLYRLGIEGDEQVKAAFAQMGEEEQRAAERAINAANRKADAISDAERRLEAVRNASGRADEKAVALITGTTAAYEANQRALRGQVQVEGQAIVVRDRSAASMGQMRAGSQQLSYQIQDVTQQFALGINPMVIFAQQGGQVVQALDLMTGGSNRFIGFMAGPWGAVLLGATMIVGTLAQNLLSSEDASNKAEEGMRRFQDRQADIWNYIERTTGSLKEQNRVLVQNAILTREKSIAENEQIIREGRQEVLRMARTAAAGGRTAEIAGLLTEAGGVGPVQADPRITRLIQQANGDVEKLAEGIAQLARGGRSELRGLALEMTNVGGSAIQAARDNDDLRREIRALTGDTSALREVDRSMLDRRAALVGATNDLERAQARFNIRVREIEQTYEGSAKSEADQARYVRERAVAERELSNARESVRTGRRADAQSLRDQRAAERQAVADAKEYANTLLQLQDRYDPLTASARRYREELAKIKTAADRGDIDAATAEKYRTGARRTFETEQMRATGADEAVRNAIRIADQFRQADQQRQQRQARVVADQQDAIVLAERELQLIGANDNLRDAEMRKLRLILGIKRDFPGATDDWIAKLLKAEMALIGLETKTRRQADHLRELHDIGGNFVDNVLDPQNWRNWGDAGRSILNELMQDVWRLAAINPLKNWLFGSDLPTFGGVLDIFGGKNGAAATLSAVPHLPPGNSSGTYDFRGGWTRLGENGPENVFLPSRSQIMRASLSRQSAAANDRGPAAPTVNVYADRAVLADEVRGWVVEAMQEAATQGAAGGSMMAQAEHGASQSKKLGRFSR